LASVRCFGFLFTRERIVENIQTQLMEVAIVGHVCSGESFVIGETQFPLNTAKPVDIFHTFDIFHSLNERTVIGKIDLTLKLILPKNDSLAETHINDLREDLEDYQDQLETIYRLVPTLKNYKPRKAASGFEFLGFAIGRHEREKAMPSIPIQEKYSHLSVPQEMPMTHGKANNEPSGYGTFSVKAPLDFEWSIGGWSNVQQIRFSSLPKYKMMLLLYCGYGWLALAFMSMINRPLFIDLGLSSFYLLTKNYGINMETHPFFIKYALYVMIALAVYDTVTFATGIMVRFLKNCLYIKENRISIQMR
jgi:hypothetical protein